MQTTLRLPTMLAFASYVSRSNLLGWAGYCGCALASLSTTTANHRVHPPGIIHLPLPNTSSSPSHQPLITSLMEIFACQAGASDALTLSSSSCKLSPVQLIRHLRVTTSAYRTAPYDCCRPHLPTVQLTLTRARRWSGLRGTYCISRHHHPSPESRRGRLLPASWEPS